MQDFGDDGVSENDSDDEHEDSGEEEGTSKSEDEDENEEWASNVDTKSDASEDEETDVQSTAEALMKLIPFNLEEFEKVLSVSKSINFHVMLFIDDY